jgi:hypothetical protein
MIHQGRQERNVVADAHGASENDVRSTIIRREDGFQEEGQRIAKCIDHGMDFRAQSAFAAPDRLVFF